MRLAKREEVDVHRERLALGVDRQHRLAALEVGGADRDLPVEPAGPQQRRVQDVGPVGGRDQDDAALGVEPVHLDQQLVQRLLALVVTAAHAGAAVPADRVDLVDEDDRRRVGLGLLEQIADPGRTDADEHLDEVRPGDRVERHPGLAGDRPGQQRLTGSRRAVEQDALGDLGAQRLVAGRVLQEVLDLVEFLDRLVGTGDIGELGLRHVLGEQLGLGLAERHDLVAAALGVVHHPQQEQDDQADRNQVDEQREQRRFGGDLGVEAIGDLGFLDRVEDLIGGPCRVLRVDLRRAVDRSVQGETEPLLLVVDEGRRHVAAAELRERDRGRRRLVAAGVVGEVRVAQVDEEHQGHPDQW